MSTEHEAKARKARKPAVGTRLPSALEYIAVCASGSLSVVCFEDKALARRTFDKIRKSYESECSLTEDAPDENGHAAFSTEDVSVAYGVADIVRKGETCLLQ